MSIVSRAVYRCVLGGVRLFYPRPRVEGLENLPEGPCVIVGNHAQIHGPIVAQLYLPRRHWTWCAAEMMQLKEVPGYAYRDFWSAKPAALRWLYRIASWLIAPLSVCLFNNADCIGVYRDSRSLSTFRESLEKLEDGTSLVVFPEENIPYNGILWRFQSGFAGLGRMYAARTGQPLPFVPMYIAPKLRLAVLGKPVWCDPSLPAAEGRERLCGELQEAVTRLATALPAHTVVPYPNLPKKQYPRSKPQRTRT